MTEETLPILEFDDDRNALIRPSAFIEPVDIARNCVLCFFSEAIEAVLERWPHRLVTELTGESFRLPVYELEYEGAKVALAQAGVGAPIAAAQVEELVALGCRRFIAVGGCGVLDDEVAAGALIVVESAVRDEGTSYHYLPPSREVQADRRVVELIADTLEGQGVPYVKAKTWTTDAFYRETPAKIQRRKAEGCLTVEMEASAYIAAARYNGVEFGQILYAGDSLGGEQWDSRQWTERTGIRLLCLQLGMDVAVRL